MKAFGTTSSALYSLIGNTNASVLAARNKLQSFETYEAGWHFGVGQPLSRAAREKAEALTAYGALFGLEVDAFPKTQGGCTVAFYSGARKVEVAIPVEGPFRIHREHGYGFDYVEDEPEDVEGMSAVRERLMELSGRVWYSSAYSTRRSLTFEAAASAAVPLTFQVGATKAPLTAGGAYQS